MVGTARDLGDNLSINFGKLKAVLGVFKNVDDFIVESDLTNSTPDVLPVLAHEKSNLEFVSLRELATKFSDQVQSICFCGNINV